MNFTIEKRKYDLAATWEEVTLKQAIKISKLDFNEEMFKRLIGVDDPGELGEEDLAYMIQVITILSDVKPATLKKIDTHMLFVIFTHVRYIINGLFYMNIETYKPIGVKEISFKGKKYYTPETLLVAGENIVAWKEKSKFVTEANNIMATIAESKKEGIELLPFLCAIYLKENPDEDYNDEKIVKRSELFIDLPMMIVWEVFFYMFYSYINFVLASRMYLIEKEKMTPLRRTSLTILGLLALPIVGLQALWKRLKK